jgi:transcriptional regulator with AAA-type ATPase domain
MSGSADLQSIRDARDGTLLIWLPARGKFDQEFISYAMAPQTKVRLIICASSAGKVTASFPTSATAGAARFTIPPLHARKDEIPALLDHWLVERRSSLRFETLAPTIQGKLVSHHWPRNLQELRAAVDHLVAFSHYRSEREAERDHSTTRSESRAWRKRMKLPLPLVPKEAASGAPSRKRAK